MMQHYTEVGDHNSSLDSGFLSPDFKGQALEKNYLLSLYV